VNRGHALAGYAAGIVRGAVRFLGPLALALFAGALQAQGTTVVRDGSAVVFAGRIDGASVTRAVSLLQDPEVTRLVITSGGGLVGPALDLADAVHARGIDVEVPIACMSSCANYVVPAARRKLLGGPGVVAWHGTMAHVMHLNATGQGTWSDAEIAEARQLARRESAFYARIGVDGFVGWFAKLPPYAVDEFYCLSPDDMARFGIGEVAVRDRDAPITNPLVQPVQVDWPGIKALRATVRPQAAPAGDPVQDEGRNR
jgi:hypothetical protein